MPRQRCAPITEKAKVDFSSHIQCDYVQQIFAGTISYALHLLVVCRPLLFRLLLELRCLFKDLRPCLFTVLQEEPRVEVDAAADVQFGRSAVLLAYLRG